MKKAKDIRNKRIILFYITAIVFPSIILGILAFRGIRNDQALTEKEQARLLKNFSVEFKSLISSKFSDTQGLFQNYLGNKAIQSEDFFSDSAINGIVEEEHLIDNIFCLIDRSRISLNLNSLLYVPDEYSAAGSIILAISPPGMEEAWDMEFRLKDFPAAIDFYKKAKGKNPGKQIKAEILNSIARNQKKGLMFTEAVESYEEILSDCSDVYFRPGVPFACLSLLEICKIKSQQGEIDELEGYLEDLLRIMLGKNYYLSVSFYSNTMEVIKEYLDTVNNDNINSLLSDIKIQDAICKRLLNFAGNFSVLTGPREVNQEKDNLMGHYSGEEFFLISLLSPQSNSSYGLIINEQEFLDQIVTESLITLNKESDFRWQIKDQHGETLSGEVLDVSEGLTDIISIPEINPYWELVLNTSKQNLFTSFLKGGNSVFLYIFILLIILLLFGLIFTLRMIRGELQLAKMKSLFITTVSHEFKSPLASIRQLAEMLDQDRVPDEERRKVYYSGILQQSERLSHLIENILDFSRMEEGRKEFNFRLSNLKDTLAEVIESYKTIVAHKGYDISLDIKNDIPDSVFDKESIEQVLINLLDNACKYSENSRLIEVSAKAVKSEIVIMIKDYGIGIGKEDHDKIFSRFYRAGDVLTQKIKGTGIGLTIVKQIITAHKGKIEVESEPGKGSTFSVILPLS